MNLSNRLARLERQKPDQGQHLDLEAIRAAVLRFAQDPQGRQKLTREARAEMERRETAGR